jgi:hypothetical protein
MELIVYGLVALAIAIAIGAALIMLATKIVAGFSPKFLNAGVVAIVVTLAGAAASWGVHLALGAGGFSSLVTVVVAFLLYAAIINALIKRPDGSAIGFGKSAVVTLVLILIEIVLAAILLFVFGAGFLSMLGAMH